MFYFRLNRIQVLDNRESGFLFFHRDRAQVKIISFVTTSNMDLPDLDLWMVSVDPLEKEAILLDAVRQVVASRTLTEVRDVKDNQILTFGDTGYVLYQSEAIPRDLNWTCLAVESDRDVRAIGASIDLVVQQAQLGALAASLSLVVAGAANPVFAAAAEITRYVLGAVARILKENGDDQIGLLYMSLNRYEHYRYGLRDRQHVLDLTGNMLVDYSIFGMDEEAKA